MIEWRDDEGPVVAVFAHPDDAEISSGGTLAKWSAEGRDVHLVVLTNGDRGSEEPDCDREALARTRAEEQKRARYSDQRLRRLCSNVRYGVKTGKLNASKCFPLCP